MFIDANRDFYHLVGPVLGEGSVIKAGNWGRVLRAAGWGHSEAFREQLLEKCRQDLQPDAPSRYDAIFCLPSVEAAREYQQINPHYSLHALHRVRLLQPERRAFIANHIYFKPSPFVDRWPDQYWMRIGTETEDDFTHPEVLTTSDLVAYELIE